MQKILNHPRLKNWLTIEILAMVVGLMGGFGAVIFRRMIAAFHYIFFDAASNIIRPFTGEWFSYALLPAGGAIIVSPLIYYGAREAKGHGVPEILEAVTLKGGVIRKRVAAIKILASAITIGSGGSAGREGPIAQIGASIASFMGQTFNLSSADLRLLVVCGLSAGIAATFNAPLGGAIFGMEVLLAHRFRPTNTIPIIISAVIATAIADYFLGDYPAFVIPKDIPHFAYYELALFLIMGITFGILAFLWVRFFYLIEDFFDDYLPLHPLFKPLLGTLLVGLIAASYYQYGVMGVGYEGIEHILTNSTSLNFLILLAVLKMTATALTIGSGNSGGVFAPSLYIGAMLGAAFGLLIQSVTSLQLSSLTLYILVGMGSLFAGAASAPLTCIIMIPEMVGNYKFLLPLMLSTSLSYIVASLLLSRTSIYSLKLQRRGVNITDNISDVLSTINVSDVMRRKVVTARSDMSLNDLHKLMLTSHHLGYPVINAQEELEGIITFEDIRKINPDVRGSHYVSDVETRAVISVHPHDSVKTALQQLTENNVGRVLVVDAQNPRKLLGLVSRSDINKAYLHDAGR